MMNLAACLAMALTPFSFAESSVDAATFIANASSPVPYVLSRLETHRVVIFGEAHWVREEVGLVRDVIARMPETRARAIGIEIFPASKQGALDAIVSADAWSEAAAVSILREAAMPHEEYLEIIEAVWRIRRLHGNDALHLVALGPGPDFRERLPEGVTYDSFMATLVKEALATHGGSILVYTGMHHAFTRYMQPETTLDGRARAFMIRMGNLLSWEFGEHVFMIASHRPVPCGEGDDWAYCAPFGAAIDCAVSKAEARGPFAFDVASSPFAELRFGERDLYVAGHPSLRLVDFVDGLVWFAPVEKLQQTRLIPLDRYAPDSDALADVSRENPFDDRSGLTRGDLEELWQAQMKRREGPILENRWKGVGDWRELCGGVRISP